MGVSFTIQYDVDYPQHLNLGDDSNLQEIKNVSIQSLPP